MRGGSHSSDADDRWKCLQAVAEELDLAVRPGLTVQLTSRVSTPELGFAPACELLKNKSKFTAPWAILFAPLGVPSIFRSRSCAVGGSARTASVESRSETPRLAAVGIGDIEGLIRREYSS